MTLSEKQSTVLAYIREHPSCSTTEIRLEVGFDPHRALVTLLYRKLIGRQTNFIHELLSHWYAEEVIAR